MASQPSRSDTPQNPDRSPKPDSTRERGSTGGGFASEEDIGTEGAGTEPRQTPEVDRGGSSGSPSTSKSGRNDKESL